MATESHNQSTVQMNCELTYSTHSQTHIQTNTQVLFEFTDVYSCDASKPLQVTRCCVCTVALVSSLDDIYVYLYEGCHSNRRVIDQNVAALTFRCSTQSQPGCFRAAAHPLFVLFQVCSDGVLLGPGPRGKAQVSAAGSVSDRVPLSPGRLRLTAAVSILRNSRSSVFTNA